MRQRFHKILVDQRLVQEGDRILVGLSGGPDSVALLALLRAVAPDFSLSLFAAHLDHGMRAESGGDRSFVENLCRNWDIPLVAKKEDIPAMARRRKVGLEEGAREVRRDFLESSARERNCSLIALGHNRGDQAETLVHRLVRGVGPAGLAAMRFREGHIIRPLLGFSRQEIVAYLEEQGLAYRTDQSNYDTRFTRNRIRHEVLPLLETFNPQLEKQLFQLSWLAAEDEGYWQGTVSALFPSVLMEKKDGLVLNVAALRKIHPALRKRLLRHGLGMVRGDLAGLSLAQILAVDELLFSPRPNAEIEVKGCWIGRNYERLCLKRQRPSTAEGFCFLVDDQEPLDIPGLGRFQAKLTDVPAGKDRWNVEFDAERVGLPLMVRSFKPGDFFQPSGMTGRKKIKDLFIDGKIDRSWRLRIPLVTTADGEILWVVGVRRSELFRLPAGGGRVLKLTFIPENAFKNLSL